MRTNVLERIKTVNVDSKVYLTLGSPVRCKANSLLHTKQLHALNALLHTKRTSRSQRTFPEQLTHEPTI